MSAGCYGCGGACCCGMLVLINSFDAHRIAQAQQLAWSQFLEASPVPEDSPQRARLEHPKGYHRLKLQERGGEQNRCIFLMELDERQWRCGIYAHRPGVCSTYPFAMVRGSVDLRDDVRCTPADWNLALLDFAGARRDLAVHSGEASSSARIDMRWNEAALASGTRTFAAYCDYARGTLERLLIGRDERADRDLLLNWSHEATDEETVALRAAWLAAIDDACAAELAVTRT